MELLVIVLNKTEYLRGILDGFIDIGIRGATVIDSAGMGHIIADHIPFLAQFAEIEATEKNNSKTIFTVVNCCERDKAIELVEDIIGDINEPDTVFLFSVPVNIVKGLAIKGCGECQ
ncbi:hypothetical protein F8154_07960 [Alkaliphilus pronyensis]|uniref:P-II family nitrogen regulator n=1 Tax=Alkaliphilus pronyensis TaxID=1482732 RepID=A0A6I0EZN6_9FIRM|nr:hypothetical protein [Alkaliphilus pronyensis]KAB3534787.1 hypothetical protein F8154_07960 [Alkaliphilus pronyensis]